MQSLAYQAAHEMRAGRFAIPLYRVAAADKALQEYVRRHIYWVLRTTRMPSACIATNGMAQVV